MIPSMIDNMIKFIPAIMISLCLIGCASSATQKRVDMGKLLTASGFKKAVADTPEKLDQLKKLPQRKITAREDGDKVFYIYADVEKCRCAYAGNEEAYKKYKQLARKDQLSEEDRQFVERNRQRQTDWGDWNFNQAW